MTLKHDDRMVTLRCPKCKSEYDVHVAQSEDMNCSTCLLEHVEIVKLQRKDK